MDQLNGSNDVPRRPDGEREDQCAAAAPQDPAETRTLGDLGAAAPPAEGDAPVVWGPLKIIAQVGRGGFGDVYRAWDATLEREVALKLLHRSVSEKAGLRDEGRLLARLRHPNVVTVYGVAEHDGRLGLWEEFIRGRTLAQVVGENGCLSAGEAISLGKDVCRALAAVHAAGLLHRDIKAQNVMREDGGRIVLMDFGLGMDVSRSQPGTQTGSVTGTLSYVAPELLRGQPSSQQSDIYALGVLLYYLVTGTFPIAARTWSELRQAQLSGRWRSLHDSRPDLPESYVQVVERALAPNPADRFETAGQLLSALAAIEAGGTATGRTTAGRRKFPMKSAALVLVLAVLAVVFAMKWGRTPSDTGNRESIVVVPFENLSADPDNDYLSAGLAEELSNELAKSSDLRVVARASAVQFKAASLNLARIQDQLHVRSVLVGSVRRSQDHIRVTAALVRTSDGTQMWSDVYDHDLKDVFAVEEEISKAVAKSLLVRLSKRPASAKSVDPVAYDFYLRGRFASLKGSPTGLQMAIEYFNKAIQVDPRYARAYAGLAHAYANLGVRDVPRAELVVKAKEAAARAVALDPDLSDGHGMLAYIKELYDWDWAGAEREFQLALKANPNDATVRLLHASLMLNLLRLGECESELAETKKVDPLAPTLPQIRGALLFVQGRFPDAEQELRKVLEGSPEQVNTRTIMGLACLREGKTAAGLNEIQRALEESRSPFVKAVLGWAYGQTGHVAEGRRILDELTREAGKGGAAPSQLAYVYGGLGDLDNAFKWMDKAIQIHDPGLVRINIAPMFDPLKKDPRFKGVLASMGLMPKTAGFWRPDGQLPRPWQMPGQRPGLARAFATPPPPHAAECRLQRPSESAGIE